MQSTIVANNISQYGVGHDLYTTVAGTVTVTHSLIEDRSGHSIANGTNDNIVGVDPLLGPLADNGGPTWTHALGNGSVALNSGTDNGLATDQRGQNRTYGGVADIGAYEQQAVVFVSKDVDSLTDEFDGDYSAGNYSLREAIFNSAPGSTINFAAGLTGTINITPFSAANPWAGEFAISKSLTINGDQRVTIDGQNQSRIFKINDGSTNHLRITLNDLTLQNGRAEGKGGGIYSLENITITNTTIHGSSATTDGGGIFAMSSTGINTISNSTISGNTASADGGGIFLMTSSGTNRIINSTIAGNTAVNDGGGLFSWVPSTLPGTTTISSTIIGNNSAGGIGNDLRTSGAGTFAANHSLIQSDDGGHTVVDSATSGDGFGNIVDDNPLLAPLADNGGFTLTHALLAGSPALNAGANPLNLQNDQRGNPFQRDDGSGVDMGAYEAQSLNLVVDNLVDENDDDYGTGDFSLREAIGLANINPEADSISFAVLLNTAADGSPKSYTGTGTINMALDDFSITDDVTIDGDGRVTIDGQKDSRIFTIDDGNSANSEVTLNNLTLKKGKVSGDGGAIYNTETLTINNTTISKSEASGKGGGIRNQDTGILTITGSTIKKNSADTSGGGISNKGASVTIDGDSVISVNNAKNGGGIHNTGTGATLTITDSTVKDNIAIEDGGGLFNKASATITGSTFKDNAAYMNGGGIRNSGAGANLTITDSTVKNNSAMEDGGGLYNKATATITGSTFSENWTSTGKGGGVHNRGSGAITITDSTFKKNTADASGGGISNIGTGVVTITDSTLKKNTAGKNGGGLFNKATATVNSSILSGNHADKDGGGVSNTDSGILTVSNSTLSGNSAGRDGGGIANSGTATINNSTVAENSATAGRGGGLFQVNGDATLNSTIVGNNTALAGADVFHSGGTLNADHSLIEDPNGHTIANGTNDNIVGVDPGLRPLADNGGSTRTHALMGSSPALHSGSNPDALANDQRGAGFNRDVGGVDMGAWEGNHLVDTLVDENDGDFSAGDYSLREAIANATDKGTILFHPDLDGPINLDPVLGELVIDKNLTIDGNDKITIDGGDNNRIFNVDDTSGTTQSTVLLAGLILQNGSSGNDGGAILNRENLTISASTVSYSYASGDGGGVFNSGTITITGSTVSENNAKYSGGGIANTGIATISQSTISNNSAKYNFTAASDSHGGGINNSGTVTIDSSTVSNNTAHDFGGGINNSGTATITASTISGNTSTRSGGGIFTYSGTLTVQNSTISGNETTNSDGGGIKSFSGITSIKNSTIGDNRSRYNGGGVVLGSFATMDIVSSIIGNNTSDTAGNDLFHEPGGTLSVDHSLIESDDGGHAVPDSGVSGDGLGNIVGADPGLGPLADNGGPTQTHVLYIGSPALNSGSNPDGLTTDQRGEARDDGTGVDMGAFEDPTGQGIDPNPGEPGGETVPMGTDPGAGDDARPTDPWWLASIYEDAEAFIDFVGKQYSSWPLFFAELEVFYTDSVNILADFLTDMESRYSETLLFWIEEFIPIFGDDPLFKPILLEMGVLLGNDSDILQTPETSGTLISINGQSDLDWYQGINERLKRHPAFESDVDKLLGGILG